uniref:Putative glycosyltransferase n=1 Tax=viral metagenome TaxID=1070528 RepID=A0A6M3K1A7_9ZZZZ
MKHHKVELLYSQYRSFGDVLVSTAIIRKLKQRFPEGEIDYLTSSACVELLSGNPDIRRIHPERFPPIWENYDVTYRPYRCLQSSAGWHTSGVHFMDLYAEACGVDLNGDYRCFFYNMGECSPGLIPILKNTVLIQTKTNDSAKDWSPENFNLLVQLLKEEGIDTVQIGSLTDPEIKGVIQDMRGQTGWAQVAICMRYALTTVCLDSAAQHLAGAIGASYIALYGAKESKLVRSGVPFQSEIQLAVDPEDRCGCNKACYLAVCNKPVKCIDTIKPETVRDLVRFIKQCKKVSC